jgi:hypothetical protein
MTAPLSSETFTATKVYLNFRAISSVNWLKIADASGTLSVSVIRPLWWGQRWPLKRQLFITNRHGPLVRVDFITVALLHTRILLL